MTDPIANMRVTLDAIERDTGGLGGRIRILRNNLDALKVRIAQRQEAFEVDLADAYRRGYQDAAFAVSQAVTPPTSIRAMIDGEQMP